MLFRKPIPTEGGKEREEPEFWNSKYILLAAIIAVSAFGIIFATTAGIFSSDPAPITGTSASTNPIISSSGASQATNPSLIVTKEDDKPTQTAKITKATKIPNPNEITPHGTLIKISNPPKYIQTRYSDLIVIDLKMKDNEITGAYITTNKQTKAIIQPIAFRFYSKDKFEVYRGQWYCVREGKTTDENVVEYAEIVVAHCQWPRDFCYRYYSLGGFEKEWQKYWKDKSGLKSEHQEKTIGQTKKPSKVIPAIKSGEKYCFAIDYCSVPENAKYVKIY